MDRKLKETSQVAKPRDDRTLREEGIHYETCRFLSCRKKCLLVAVKSTIATNTYDNDNAPKGLKS